MWEIVIPAYRQTSRKIFLIFFKIKFYPVSEFEIADIPMKKSGFRNDGLMSLNFYL
jgi:hypothetical protein